MQRFRWGNKQYPSPHLPSDDAILVGRTRSVYEKRACQERLPTRRAPFLIWPHPKIHLTTGDLVQKNKSLSGLLCYTTEVTVADEVEQVPIKREALW